MKRIKLTNGGYTLVDDEDFERLNKYKWRVVLGYVVRTAPQIRMNREIMKTRKGFVADHVNGNRLDNRRKNLRNCTHSENNRNKGKIKNAASRFKGVSKQGHLKQWRVQIMVNGRALRIGSFDNEHHAALAYDLWAILLHGKFAKTNFRVVSHK